MEKTARIKTMLSATFIIFCITSTIFVVSGLTHVQEMTGAVVDFGGGKTYFGAIPYEDDPDSQEGLETTCNVFSFELLWDGDMVISIDSIESGTDERAWGLYIVEKSKTNTQDSYEWKKISGNPREVIINDYAAVAWAYCSEEESPSRAVDATGKCFYGYGHPNRIISLAPSCTEMVCSVGGERKLVGADEFSNYPESVESARKSGKITRIGGFTNPSYEYIIKSNPDLVVCINSQHSHINMAERLRSVGINVVVVDGGEDVSSILEGIMMVGTAIGTRGMAENIISGISSELYGIKEKINSNSSAPKNAMVALSTDKSPWTSGSYTYASDILDMISVGNSFSDLGGWVMVNSESLVKRNINYIVVVNNNGPSTQDEYNKAMESLGDEWKLTDAYINRNIYFLTDSAADLASRAGPRVAQFTELMARIIQGTAFYGGVPTDEMPKYIGDNYRDFISLTNDPVVKGYA